MASKPNESQRRAFHTKEWTLNVERRFVSGPLREANAGNYREGSVNNDNAIRRLMNEVNFCFNTTFDYKYCYEQTRRLRQRYEAFSKIIALEGVKYSEEDNKIQCDPTILDEICKAEHLALAYREFCEPHYNALRRIFEVGDDSVGYKQLPPITSISSSFNSLSIMPTRMPQIQQTPYSSIWKGIAGSDSDASDARTNI